MLGMRVSTVKNIRLGSAHAHVSAEYHHTAPKLHSLQFCYPSIPCCGYHVYVHKTRTPSEFNISLIKVDIKCPLETRKVVTLV